MAIGKIDSENLGERERGGECGRWLSAAQTADKVDIGVLERALLLETCLVSPCLVREIWNLRLL